MTESIPALLKRASTAHPRLMLTHAGLDELKADLGGTTICAQTAAFIIATAREILPLSPLTREMEGRRLLEVSRICLKRMQFLGMAYLLTEEEAFAKQGEAQLLAVCDFDDWNPSHMLDVAEMCAAVAIGYDWMFHGFSEEGRERIKQGLIKLGIDVLAEDDAWWVTAHNNWNQVCHCGAVLGALALHEELPDVSAAMVERAVKCLPIAMKEYAPDGGYPEGPMYWDYGTSFNVMIIEALTSVLGTDLGVSEAPGFMSTGDYQRQVTGTSGVYFNYADCHRGGGMSATMFWFAHKRQDSSLLHGQLPRLQALVTGEPRPEASRLRTFPIILPWLKGVDQPGVPTVLHKRYDGTTPVGLHRSGWGTADAFAGLKAGSPSAPHGHMDTGTFVIDRFGKRWAEDIGAENYHKVESLGMNLWTSEQSGERWKIFRLSNFAHNTLTVNDELHLAASDSPITKFSDNESFAFTQLDMTPALSGQLASVQRGLGMTADGDVVIQDEVEAERAASVRWAMMTKAKAELIQPNQVKLTLGDESLLMTAVGGLTFTIADISQPVNSWDSPNTDLSRVSATYDLADGENKQYAVWFHSIGSEAPASGITPLVSW